MRVRPLALIVAIFGAAALATAFVVSQFPREGQVSPLPAAAVAPALPEISPPLVPAATPADGAVEVRVTAGPEPLGAAEVRLYAAPASDGEPWRRAGEATTDPAGVARIAAGPGAYLAVARSQGLAPARAEVVRAAGDRETRVLLVLELPATLEGRASIQGGGAVASARVRLVPLVSSWPGFAPPSAPPEETAAGATDASGAFRIAGLSPGSFAVLVDAAGYHPVLVPRVPVPGGAVPVTLEPIGAVAGTVVFADGRPAAGAAVRAASTDHGATAVTGPDGRYRLPAPSGSYAVSATLGDRAGALDEPVAVAAGSSARAAALRLGPAARVEGEVTRAAGGAAAGAEVALFAHGSRELVARAVAAADGRFALGWLPPGAYELRATGAGSSPAILAGVTVGAGERFHARLVLPGTGEVTGAVRDPAGRPLAGIRVRALQRGDGLVPRAPVEARTDFDGRFRLRGVEVGRAELVARHDSVQIGTSRAVRVPDGRAAPVDLVLPDSGVLAGRATADGHAPPPGTTVVAVALRAGPGTMQMARAVTDASGNYVLPLPAGDYRVHAAPGLAARTDLRVSPAFAHVEPGRTARLELAVVPAPREQGAEILVLEPGGAPSPGATVTLARPDDGKVALATSTGDDGRVTLDAQMGMAGRPVAIRARNGGRAGATTVALPQAGTVVVRLSPGGAVAGVVRGARQGFTLELSSQPAADGWRTLDVHRFAGERFELGDLPPEPLRLVVRSSDGRRGSAELRVAPGETRAVEIALR